MNRDKIINRLNALRAKAEGTTNIHEATIFMDKFNSLMREYNLTLTDLEIKSSTVNGFTKAPTKQLDEMGVIVLHIAELTDTKVVCLKADNYTFLGLNADLQYANWLYELIAQAMERSLTAYIMSPDYHKRINSKQKPAEIKRNFKVGFCYAINTALKKMIEENRIPGKALILLKNELIQRFMEENNLEGKQKTTAVAIYEGMHEVVHTGHEEGKKVRLRKEAESVVKGYIS